ncbi:metallophosphoesterase [Nannocystis bainbridge]|uniref:Metallophosphoesterase n=1 Tax=Nannocystis bainbridge TaxID=2995303 RepID=A0ABT5E6A6_9BACT|nr:metallophosphoesterase [Nannocystis bainbridge]MDC0721388.1 metallophosphoesterase [Nannocystis bainbridge]
MQSTLIIGDIHGCYAELLDLLDVAAIGDDDLVVSVGDLVDRGPDPSSVVELFRSRPHSLALCGNHERKHIRGVLSYSQQVAKLQLGADYADHVGWMATLPYHWERDDVRVVHWGLFPGVPLDEVPEDVRAGTTSGEARLRERFGERPWYEFYDDDKPVVFGHAVVGPEPLVLRDRIFGIDTGVCHGMRLTGLLLPQFKLVSVPARADHWARVRGEWQAPVLRTLPWQTMTFEQIEKKVRSLRDPELDGAVLDQVQHWLTTLRGALPQLRERLDAEVARIAETAGEEFGRAAAAHPAGSWLLRRRAGKLSPEHLGCASPRQLLALGSALGVTLASDPV